MVTDTQDLHLILTLMKMKKGSSDPIERQKQSNLDPFNPKIFSEILSAIQIL